MAETAEQRQAGRMSSSHPKIVFFGAGAIGSSVGAWVSGAYDNVWLFDKPEVTSLIQGSGITTYQGGDDSTRVTVHPRVIADLDGLADADVIAVCVKNYSLEPVCVSIKKVCGDRPIIIGFQNGAENQTVLPRYFSKSIYCVIGYNAWLDAPNIVGYQKKGPLILGALDDASLPMARDIGAIFNRGVETVVVDHLQDAVHSKIIINLTNSLTTLIGLGFQPVSNYALFQKILSHLTYEGVQIVKAAGHRECKIGGMPPWFLIHAAVSLPLFLTRPIFKKNVKKMVVSSMAQDIIKRGGHDSELDTINGYMLSLADKHGIKAPYNRAVYDLCAREFRKNPFHPVDIAVVWDEIQSYL